jgi:glutamate-1-semialdehyde 2,1-aminomutase
MPPGLDDNLVLVPYNRPELLESAFKKHAHELACIICEPVYYTAGCIVPACEFMALARHLTEETGVLLIFDEVLSAFRMGASGAQGFLGITPDLCTLGKAVGGGYPLSVFGGKKRIMDRLMPTGDCQHSGTYNGHMVAVAAALAAVQAYREPGFYEHIHAIAEILYSGLNDVFQSHDVPGRVQGLGARFGVYFGLPGKPREYRDAVHHQRERMLQFIAAAIRHGVYFHDYGGAACHHGFCHAMSVEDAKQALQRLDAAVVELKSGR